jgi:hypothetical protein
MADEPGNDTADTETQDAGVRATRAPEPDPTPGATRPPEPDAPEAARPPEPDAAAETAGLPDVELVEADAVATVVVRSSGELAAPGWRGRAVALRSALPQLARHPVVVGASAAAATIAVRVAVEVARQALGAQATPRSITLEVTGKVVHEVHVVRHVHVFHHYPVPVSWWPPPPPR